MLLAGGLVSAGLPDAPPADFQKSSSHNVLFVIPYGNAENQIYLEYTPGPGEGELSTAIAPTGFRALTDGRLAIVAGYPDKVVVQVFTQDGKLARAAPQPTVKTISWTRLYLHSDGSMYYAKRLPHFCQGYKRLMVVTPEGEIVYEDWVQGPPMTEWCVPDGRGNLYYLNFTDAGVEVKKVKVP